MTRLKTPAFHLTRTFEGFRARSLSSAILFPTPTMRFCVAVRDGRAGGLGRLWLFSSQRSDRGSRALKPHD